jgi:hypothetical protein
MSDDAARAMALAEEAARIAAVIGGDPWAEYEADEDDEEEQQADEESRQSRLHFRQARQ